MVSNRLGTARYSKALKEDFVMIIAGVFLAIAIIRTPYLGTIIASLQPWYPLSAFIVGVFFTSAFTIAPSAILLTKIGGFAPGFEVALWGGLGAMVGDMIIFLFIRDRFATDLKKALKGTKIAGIVARTFHFGFMKWLSPILGAVIIASPLPDEFGLALMGLSQVRLIVLLPIAFVMNVLGILALMSFAQFF